MANLYTCGKCKGRKSILSTGNMFKECTACHGIGKVKEKPLKPDVASIGVKDETRLPDKVVIGEVIPAERKGKPRKKVFSTSENEVAIQSGSIGSIQSV